MTTPTESASTMSTALRAVVGQVWPELDGAVQVSGDRQSPPGCVVAERYLVVPSLRRARFVVPLSTRAAAVSSMVSYNRLREPATRVSRRSLGIAVAAGGGRLVGEPLYVHVRSDAAASGTLLAAHLGEVLGVDRVGVGVGVRPPGPNSKPTLVCLADDGRPLGFAKVGWNAVTDGLVATEAAALRRAAVLPPDVLVPGVVHDGHWNGRRICLTTPLPADVVRWGPAQPPPALEVTTAVAAVGTATTQRLVASGQLRRLREVAETPGWDAAIRHAYLGLVDRLAESAIAETETRFGAWHGDWAPWNLGHSGSAVAAWDWEHYRDDVLLGLDLVNWQFRIASNLGGKSVEAALHHALVHSGPLLRPLHSDPGFPAAATAVYALELTARYEAMSLAGGGRAAPINTGLAAALGSVGEWLDQAASG